MSNNDRYVILFNCDFFLQKLPITIFDTDPSDWVNLGVETSSNGTVENLTFDDLWNKYENPDLGDVVANNEIMSVIISSFYNKI